MTNKITIKDLSPGPWKLGDILYASRVVDADARPLSSKGDELASAASWSMFNALSYIAQDHPEMDREYTVRVAREILTQYGLW